MERTKLDYVFSYQFNTDLYLKHLCVKNHSLQLGKCYLHKKALFFFPPPFSPQSLPAAHYLLNLTVQGRPSVASQVRPDLRFTSSY